MWKDSLHPSHIRHDEKGIQKVLANLGLTTIEVENVKQHCENKEFKAQSLIYSQIGLFLVSKSKIGRKLKLAVFISYFDIQYLEYKSNGTFFFKIKTGDDLILEFSDTDKFIHRITDLYTAFFSRNPNHPNLIIKNCPIQLQVSDYQQVDNASLLQYFSMCSKYNQAIDLNTRKIIESFQNSSRISITLDRCCATPVNYKIISRILIEEPKLKILKFDNFAPKNVCKIIYHVLKHNKNITTIIMTNYDSLLIEQFNFNNLKNPSVICWNFSSMNLEDQRTKLLFDEFMYYHGDIQKLSIDNCRFINATAEKLGEVLRTAYAFRTLEILEINFISIPREHSLAIFKAFLRAVSCLKTLQLYSANGWSNPVLYQIDNSQQTIHLFESSCIKHISVSNLDLRLITKEVVFPPSVNILEINNCVMNCASLTQVLKAASRLNSPLVLSLQSIQINSNEYNFFINSSHVIPKFTNIVELDYSNNQIPKRFIPEFYRIFINSSPIKCLCLNRVFGPSQLSDICKILNHLKTKSIWGIELSGGENNTTFQKITKVLLNILKELKSLEYLNLAEQGWALDCGNDMISFLSEMKQLRYLSVDGARFGDLNAFVTFYNFLFTQTNIVAVIKQFADLSALVPNKSIIEGNPPLEKIISIFRMKSFHSSRLIRSHYFMRYNDMNNFTDFRTNFPIYISGVPEKDQFDLNIISEATLTVRSLIDYDFVEIHGSFSQHQQKFIGQPFEDVQVFSHTIPEFEMPDELAKYHDKYQASEELTAPKITPKLNTRDIISKYRKWITYKHQRMFRNLAMLSNLFNKVNDDERGVDSFGCNLHKVDPPTFIPLGAIQIITNQVENINDDNSENDYDEISFSTMTAARNEYAGSHNSISPQHSDSRLNIYSDNEETENSGIIPSLSSPMLLPIPFSRNHGKRMSEHIQLVNVPVSIAKRRESFAEMFDADYKGPQVEEIDAIPLKSLREQIPDRQQSNTLERIEEYIKPLEEIQPTRYVRTNSLPLVPPSTSRSMPNIPIYLMSLYSTLCPLLAHKSLRKSRSRTLLSEQIRKVSNGRLNKGIPTIIDVEDEENGHIDQFKPVLIKKESQMMSLDRGKRYGSSSNASGLIKPAPLPIPIRDSPLSTTSSQGNFYLTPPINIASPPTENLQKSSDDITVPSPKYNSGNLSKPLSTMPILRKSNNIPLPLGRVSGSPPMYSPSQFKPPVQPPIPIPIHTQNRPQSPLQPQTLSPRLSPSVPEPIVKPESDCEDVNDEMPNGFALPDPASVPKAPETAQNHYTALKRMAIPVFD
ncbi:hypothetical protein TRFO_34325 [Tritrichomonas foetus]|uniref:Uncharacterized protein n=1 Tax=Tritrichomonas foetus TaxID=1144522 RepID=A0A1J4JLK8_9EUKA|nr:hypothetical protein TRFO_34325 [Tritrichomonas foetus]|eukprot:OHS99287.1 hypothetical protein TRFO_34325 [Tritrichomonas foetus]